MVKAALLRLTLVVISWTWEIEARQFGRRQVSLEVDGERCTMAHKEWNRISYLGTAISGTYMNEEVEISASYSMEAY